MAYAVGSAPGGGTLMSDGSVKYMSYGGYSNFTPKSSGNVLGTSDVAKTGSSTQKQNGGWYNGVQYWEPGKDPNQGGDGGGGDGGGVNNSDIDALYEPAMRATYDVENALNTGSAEDIASLEGNYKNELGKTETEKTNLLADTGTAQSSFEKTLRSALSEALRAYNALQQQTRARFGMGNSAGQAVGELAQQEFFRQQGAVGEKGVEGSAQFETEKSRIGQFAAQKAKDLEIYKQEALNTIKQNLRTQLAEVAARRGDIEANKTRDKMSILQDNINRARQIESEAKQFRQNLALASVQQMQSASGRAFSPQEFASLYDQVNAIMNNKSVIGGTTSAPTTLAYNRRPTKTDEEQLQGLQ